MTNDALRIEAVADRLAVMLQGWTGSTADTRDELVAELRDIAAIRALSADRGEAVAYCRDGDIASRVLAHGGGAVWLTAQPDGDFCTPLYTTPPSPAESAEGPKTEGDRITEQNEAFDIAESMNVAAPSGVSDAMVEAGAKAAWGMVPRGVPWEEATLCSEQWRGIARIILEAASQPQPGRVEGMVQVPIEPTYQMAEAMGVKWESGEGFPRRWKAALAAYGATP